MKLLTLAIAKFFQKLGVDWKAIFFLYLYIVYKNIGRECFYFYIFVNNYDRHCYCTFVLNKSL